MNIDRLVNAMAGTFILISLILSQIHSLYWLWLTAFVGANLLQASFTGFCPVVFNCFQLNLGLCSGEPERFYFFDF